MAPAQVPADGSRCNSYQPADTDNALSAMPVQAA